MCVQNARGWSRKFSLSGGGVISPPARYLRDAAATPSADKAITHHHPGEEEW
jgi:hypothetical protein